MHVMKNSIRENALMDICSSFAPKPIDPDAGLAILFWMHGLYHIRIPNHAKLYEDNNINTLRSDLLAIHGIMSFDYDNCEGDEEGVVNRPDTVEEGDSIVVNKWPDDMRYDQEVMIGKTPDLVLRNDSNLFMKF